MFQYLRVTLNTTILSFRSKNVPALTGEDKYYKIGKYFHKKWGKQAFLDGSRRAEKVALNIKIPEKNNGEKVLRNAKSEIPRLPACILMIN